MNKINISALRALITFTCLFFIIILTHAQNKTYTIHGQIVTGDDSVAVKGAIIQIPGTKFRDTTNADGFYKISKLPAGTSSFTITAANFEKWAGTVVVKSNQTINFRINRIPSPQDPDDPGIADKPKDKLIDTAATDPGLKIFEEPSDKKKKKKKEEDELKEKEKKKKEEEKEKEKKDKDSKDKGEKPKKKSKDELIAEEFARKAIYEKLIEDVVAFENIYFSKFEPEKNTVTAKGFFSIESKQIYSFTAVFAKTGETYKLQNILVALEATK